MINFFLPQAPNLKNRDNNTIYFLWLLGELIYL